MRGNLVRLAALSAWLLPQSVYAGVYSDDLSKCLVASTTQEDRLTLVNWMFAAASLHPSVTAASPVSAEALDQVNKKMADLFMRLVTVSCKTQVEKALQYEGEVTFQTSFQVLGQVAGRELFSSPEVSAAMSGVQKHLDLEKLQALSKPAR
jgi:hypothetical protein